MTDDCRIGFEDIASDYTTSKTLEKVERAYAEVRDTDDQDFGSLDDNVLDIGAGDLWGM